MGCVIWVGVWLVDLYLIRFLGEWVCYMDFDFVIRLTFDWLIVGWLVITLSGFASGFGVGASLFLLLVVLLLFAWAGWVLYGCLGWFLMIVDFL